MNFRSRLSILALLTGCCTALPADAGYIFMKNGYIIQGRVVEKSDEKIVLRWTEGDMSIDMRFIVDVVLDGHEEQDLRELEEVRKSSAQPADQQSALEHDIQLELPDNLEELVPAYAMRGATDAGSAVVEASPLGPGDTNGTPVDGMRVEVMPPGPAERSFDDAGFAITLPAGWECERNGDVIRASKTGSDSSAMCVAFQKEVQLGWMEACGELKLTLERNYPGVRMGTSEETTWQGTKTFRLSGELPSRSLKFACYQLQLGPVTYLITSTERTDATPEEKEDLQSLLASFRLLK